MFRKILVANRGEIACRVMRTARRMGMRTVAVYSSADAAALHVDSADEAWPIGASPARESYLSIPRIIEAARKSGADAVHPGYGFLSENAAFADACAEAGIVFIGPPASAMRAMGSKAAAKALMARAGVPLVPGYHGDAQDVPVLQAAADEIGFPVLIKASAGGGGKGMRVVTQAADLLAAIEGARREAAASFGDDRLLIEKYLTRPRHIEIQVFADTHGKTVSLFERDCSIQRRHQKVVEEAPAPGMDPGRRAAMGDAACAAARAVGYVGAGTVEFIAQDGDFHFMEMNTRLQVEHPVTEMVTGLDLVEWQFRVAAGEALPEIPSAPFGHAIEMRVYAEDPERDFLPSIGRIVHLRQPLQNAGVRVDTGVCEGDWITPYYDPMIAKLIVHGADRAEAVGRLRGALDAYEIVGVQSNLGLLRAIAAHEDFAEGGVDTGFIARENAALFAPWPAQAHKVLAAATLAWIVDIQRSAGNSPWGVADAWRMNGEGTHSFMFMLGTETISVRAVVGAEPDVRLDLPGGTRVAAADGDFLRLDGVRHRARVVRHEGLFTVIIDGRNTMLRPIDPWAPPASDEAADDRLTAPIPARVARVLVQAGDYVRKGAALVVLEAMKMELTLSAPMDAIIETVRFGVDNMVTEGAVLVTLAGAGKA
jgi:3-methylcrotonyl-CoA carboxylase alpha subunit